MEDNNSARDQNGNDREKETQNPSSREVTANDILPVYIQKLEVTKENLSKVTQKQKLIDAIPENPDSSSPDIQAFRAKDAIEKAESLLSSKEKPAVFIAYREMIRLYNATEATLYLFQQHMEKRSNTLGLERLRRKEQELKNELERREAIAAEIFSNFEIIKAPGTKEKFVRRMAREFLIEEKRRKRQIALVNETHLRLAKRQRVLGEVVHSLRSLKSQKVRRYLAKDGRTWVLSIEEVREQARALNRSRERTHELEHSLS